MGKLRVALSRNMKLSAISFVGLLTFATTSVLALNGSAGLSELARRNEPPRLSDVTVNIGRVYDERQARVRQGGLRISFRLCDDGPRSGPATVGLVSLTHRWGDRLNDWLLVRERSELIAYDIYFSTPECRARIPWSSTLPADLSYARIFRCYQVTVRVRDPGGRWSNRVTRVVKKC